MKPLSCRSAIINVTGKTYKGRKWVKLRNFKQHSNVKLNIIKYDVVDFHLNLAWHLEFRVLSYKQLCIKCTKIDYASNQISC